MVKRGHIFVTRSDSEVIVHGYEQWGESVLEHLIGEFAIAIWDGRRQQLFFARDRLGVKPLYYSRVGDMCVFASEIKAILATNCVESNLDLRGLLGLFVFSFVPGSRTMFDGIREVLPGHCISMRGGRFHIRRYWDIAFPCEMDEYPKLSTQEWADRYRFVLMEAVTDRLQADVPVGALLSGGIDSSSIVALATKQGAVPIDTFSLEVNVEGQITRQLSRSDCVPVQ